MGDFKYIFNWDKSFDFINVFSKLFAGAYDTITQSGLPNIFCGVIVLALVFCFFFIKSIGLIEKFFTLILLGIFFVSFYLTSIDIIWHAFQTPNWFPFRYSFIFSFFLLFIAFKAFTKLKEIPIFAFVSFLFLFSGVTLWIFKSKFSFLTDNSLYLSIILVVIYVFAICILKYKIKLNVIILPIILCVTIFEMNFNTQVIVSGLDNEFGYKPIAAYTDFTKKLAPLVDKANSLETGFFRMDKTFDYSRNDALGFGYSGFESYTATYNRNINSFLKNLGFSQGWFVSFYYGSTAVTDSLFGVKYVMSKLNVNDNYPLIEKSQDISLYQNPYALSLAFMGNESLLTTSPTTTDALENQKSLLTAFTNPDQNCFNKIEDLKITKKNVKLFNDNGSMKYMAADGGLGSITYHFKVKKDNHVYASFLTNNYDEINFFVNGKSIGSYLQSDENKHNIYFGGFKKDQNVSLKLEFNKFELLNQYIYSLDMNEFSKVVDSIRQQELKITHFSSTNVTGNIDVTDKTLMFTSIPYDKGWTVLVDGQITKTEKYANTLMCVKLPPGKHLIEMSFTPDGFSLGLPISLTALFLVILINVLFYMKRKKSIIKIGDIYDKENQE